MTEDDDMVAAPCDDSLMVTVSEEEEGARLDRILADKLPDLSRTRLKNLINDGDVTVAGAVCESPSRKVKAGEVLKVTVPPPVDSVPQAENIPLDILYEDDDILVINKAVGMVVHPGAGNHSGTLVNALLYHCQDSLSGIGGVIRPGIVHRLDKNTSGVMIVAKNDKAHASLSEQLSTRTLSRIYKAVVWRVPSLRKGTVDQPIGRHNSNRTKMAIKGRDGRVAVTHYSVLEDYGCAALVECRLQTGRTHQIRVHMEHIGHPLVGDPVYSLQPTASQAALKKAGVEEEERNEILSFPRQALHAWRIVFKHPVLGDEMAFEAPLPDDLDALISFFNQ